jgi:serine/threonine protein phosphatase 1
MKRTFIIGDIHGCCKTFQKLVLEEIRIGKKDQIYCLGDYIDRGPDSRGVIYFILDLKIQGFQIHTLRGNHEQLLHESEMDSLAKAIWINNGGDKALASFKADSIRQLEPKYLEFFRKTKYFINTADFFLVHAGLNFQAPDPLADKNSMLWIRNFSVNNSFLKGKILVHGHTPKQRNFIHFPAF